jgi:ADP-ribose pyrophosphatase
MDDPDLRDRPADAVLTGPDLIGRGLYRYERFRVALAGNAAGTLTRDIVRVGRVVVIVTIDLVRDEVVLIRQFRLGAHLAIGLGELVELPAGRVEPGEELIDAARRECLEEIGIAPHTLVPIFSVLPSSGVGRAHEFFLGLVNSSKGALAPGRCMSRKRRARCAFPLTAH